MLWLAKHTAMSASKNNWTHRNLTSPNDKENVILDTSAFYVGPLRRVRINARLGHRGDYVACTAELLDYSRCLRVIHGRSMIMHRRTRSGKRRPPSPKHMLHASLQRLAGRRFRNRSRSATRPRPETRHRI